ncbi:MAG: Oligopeptide transport ATP-binding protein OppD [uncultured Nocardioidaceae bacterium]|uniref:Oligopeptide transport ATP-binding protein OppD n=1 Tax=uncultured Nocardioidaceae bacterium TaxID=253824 RepID=A0A6J4MVA9_9ACTN|nr:MAG: Oligopeptide transport ATP-binding protein OppD [uncultured Nocardioidaceae bacterium]
MTTGHDEIEGRTRTAPAPASVVEAKPDDEALLTVDRLKVTFTRHGSDPVTAVDDVSFSVRPGEHVGLVGESGSGKSVTSLAIMGLLPKRGVQVEGSVSYAGRELIGMPQRTMRNLRGSEMAMVFQDPMTSLNPVITVGRQVREVLERHRGLSRHDAHTEAVDLLRRVGIPDPGRRVKEYPHQLSGGMRQRVLIAIALAAQPRVLIADEPTTALDVTIQAQILELLKELVATTGTALIMITHDLGVVAGLCDRVHVMYGGRIVESNERRELFGRPRHPYTGGLMASIPRLDQPRGVPLQPIPGSPIDLLPWEQGCAFAPRCPNAAGPCRSEAPVLEKVGPGALRCYYPLTGEARGRGEGE